MQIRPNTAFPIVYVLTDPSDSGTYYVRAVVRNSATGAIIKVNGLNYVNLVVDSGNSRRFSKLINAPQDSAGNGFYIDVTTTVYTDSGYTIVSETYQEENIKYLVQELWSVALGSGGGNGYKDNSIKEGGSIDYEKLKKIILECLATIELPSSDEVTVPMAVFHDEIKSALLGLAENMPKEGEKIDLKGHHDSMLKGISDLFKKHKPAEIDFAPILAKIDALELPTPTIEFPQVEDNTKAISQFKQEIKADILEIKKLIPQNNKFSSFMSDLNQKIRSFDSSGEYDDSKTNMRAKSLTS